MFKLIGRTFELGAKALAVVAGGVAVTAHETVTGERGARHNANKEAVEEMWVTDKLHCCYCNAVMKETSQWRSKDGYETTKIVCRDCSQACDAGG